MRRGTVQRMNWAIEESNERRLDFWEKRCSSLDEVGGRRHVSGASEETRRLSLSLGRKARTQGQQRVERHGVQGSLS